jgi:hypothetical protein
MTHGVTEEGFVNATTGVGGDVRNSASFCSWGALLGFVSLVEEGYF